MVKVDFEQRNLWNNLKRNILEEIIVLELVEAVVAEIWNAFYWALAISLFPNSLSYEFLGDSYLQFYFKLGGMSVKEKATGDKRTALLYLARLDLNVRIFGIKYHSIRWVQIITKISLCYLTNVEVESQNRQRICHVVQLIAGTLSIPPK